MYWKTFYLPTQSLIQTFVKATESIVSEYTDGPIGEIIETSLLPNKPLVVWI